MENFIPSEYYRNFCKENNIAFSDREHAVMLHQNMQLPLIKKLALLDKLAAETSNDELKNEIVSWIEYKNKLLEKMNDHRVGEDFYLIHCCGVPVVNGIFDSFESARKGLEKLTEDMDDHIITKEGYFGKNPSELGYKCAVELSRSGEIISVYEPFDISERIRIKDEFIPFANPFERGDIVRDCRNGKIGVVETSQKKWSDILKNGEENKSHGFSGAALSVQFLRSSLFDNGCGSHREHIQPIYLEKLPLNEKGIPESFDTKNNLEEDLITCVSELMRGWISLDVFMSIFLEWREENIRKNIKRRIGRGELRAAFRERISGLMS